VIYQFPDATARRSSTQAMFRLLEAPKLRGDRWPMDLQEIGGRPSLGLPIPPQLNVDSTGSLACAHLRLSRRGLLRIRKPAERRRSDSDGFAIHSTRRMSEPALTAAGFAVSELGTLCAPRP
jgi:hypothetical protein